MRHKLGSRFLPIVLGIIWFASPGAGAVCTANLPNPSVTETTPDIDLTAHGNGTVTHLKTGLMWKQCAEGLSGATCAEGTSTALSWANALKAANTANAAAFAGYTDWRLPNQKELQSIVEYCGRFPAINQNAFPSTPSLTFWSSTTIVKFPAAAWEVEFNDGSTNSTHKSASFRARLVRGGEPGVAVASEIPTLSEWALGLLALLLGGFGAARLRRRCPAATIAVFAAVIATTAGLGRALASDLFVASNGGGFLSNGSVLRYDPITGAFRGVFVAPGSGGMERGVKILFTPSGDLLVLNLDLEANAENRSVLRYDGRTGAFLGVFIPVGIAGFPSDIAFGPDGHLYLADYGQGTVRRHDGKTGAPLGTLVDTGTIAPISLIGLTFGPDSNLYALERNLDRVLKFSGTSGAFLGVFVGAAGGLAEPQRLRFAPDGSLFVHDRRPDGTSQLRRYNGESGALAAVGVLSNVELRDFAFDQAGQIYGADFQDLDVERIDPTNSFEVSRLIEPGSAGLASPAALAFGPCSLVQPLSSLCLQDGRFRVNAAWRTATGETGIGHPVRISDDTGYFWFFSAANAELMVKVLDACGLNSRFWTFAGGLTNVRTTLTVTDTQTGAVRNYTNPQNTAFLPVQDTGAFATCP